MGKDTRLYARFDINMDEHAKIFLLSDAAFRALIESTLYSRRQLTDGFIPEALAVRKWGKDVLEELTSNDPEKPSWRRTKQGGVAGIEIHDFAKHQTTSADIEGKREAGRKGAAKRWASNKDSERMAGAMAGAIGDPMRIDGSTLAKTETETETKTETYIEVSKDTSSSEVETSRPEYEKLLDLLDSLIVANGSKKPSRSKKNVDSVRLMVERDGRSLSDIEGAIRWSQANEFWRGNILSMSKLREKFDQLRLAAQRDRERREGSQLTENQTRAVSLHQQYLQEEGEGFAEITVG